jgi:hypothetical protein
MKSRLLWIVAIFFFTAYAVSFPQSFSKIDVKITKANGEYSITSEQMHWTFKGSLNKKLTNIKNIRGKDALGNFQEIEFAWNDSISCAGIIKWYELKPVVIFSLILPDGSKGRPQAFPSFTEFPKDMHTFSYYNDAFAPPQFKLNETSTPWLFFNNQKNAFIISPASDFIVSKLYGDGNKLISSSLNENIKNLPARFTHKTILVLGKGIINTWNTWGKAMKTLYKRKMPANDANPVLKYYGYWTDNGADYYYSYDTTIGYSRTLLDLRKKYEKEGIPLGYMQLDSWWYEKSIYAPNGKPVADHKNKKLPFGKWNRYGGLMSYTADPFLFPNGLSGFQKKLDLPLVTHNRWIDPKSPYHDNYKISGFAAIDPNFWNHIIDHIKQAGVICYEQDWLNYIYRLSPEMAENLEVGNAFTDGMANACKKDGLTMQYCMAMPRYFLQGLKYNNLTSIRTSDDRFEPKKWKSFLYTSQLAYECGIYPWCDVFKSSELGNMIFSVLSDGPVGTGDAIGKEDKENIMMACRKDGVLVKPDVPILPVDNDYLNDAEGAKTPILGYTYTKQNNITTGYVFTFANDTSDSRKINFNPSELGLNENVVVYNPLTKKVQVVDKADAFNDVLPNELYTYYILAPINPAGIAFLGDSGKIVSTGKKRIESIVNNNGLEVKVLFAKNESSVNLEGYSENPVSSSLGKINYDSNTHLFSLILPSNGKEEVTVNIKTKM